MFPSYPDMTPICISTTERSSMHCLRSKTRWIPSDSRRPCADPFGPTLAWFGERLDRCLGGAGMRRA